MQDRSTLCEIIKQGNPNITEQQCDKWIFYLQQLKGCQLLAAIPQAEDQDGWLAVRKVGLGGSDIAAVMGESPWTSPRQIWRNKVLPPEETQRAQSEPARWGNVLESVIAEEWAKRENRQFVHISVTLQSIDEPWRLANIDGFTLTDDRQTITGILEIKTTSAYNQDAWVEGPLPFYYICQANWYADICGLDMIDFACLIGGQRLVALTLPTIPDLQERMRIAAKDFWHNNVLAMVEPELKAQDVIDVAATEHDEALPAIIYEDDETERLVDSYVQLREKEKAIKEIKEAVYAKIWPILGKSTQALTRTRLVKLKITRRRNCKFDMLEKNYPEVYKECVYTSVSSSLDIK